MYYVVGSKSGIITQFNSYGKAVDYLDMQSTLRLRPAKEQYAIGSEAQINKYKYIGGEDWLKWVIGFTW